MGFLLYVGVVVLLGGGFLAWRPTSTLRTAARLRYVPFSEQRVADNRRLGLALAVLGAILIVVGVLS